MITHVQLFQVECIVMVLGHAALIYRPPSVSSAHMSTSSAPWEVSGGENSLDGSAESEAEALRGRQRELCRCSLELLASRMGYRDRAEYLAFHMQVRGCPGHK